MKRTPRSKSSRSWNTKERKASKARTEKKITALILKQEGEVISCPRCNKPKRLNNLPERARGYCRCGVKTKYRPEFCASIIDFFEQAKNEIAVDRQYFQPRKD